MSGSRLGSRPSVPAGSASSVGLPSDRTLLLAGLGGIGSLAYAALSEVTGGRIGVPCLLRLTTGLDCPFCGATRMAAALLRGDLGAAVHFNAMVLVGALLASYVWIGYVAERLTGLRLPRPRPGARSRRWLGVVAVVAMIGFTVARNLPWPPFTALHV